MRGIASRRVSNRRETWAGLENASVKQALSSDEVCSAAPWSNFGFRVTVSAGGHRGRRCDEPKKNLLFPLSVKPRWFKRVGLVINEYDTHP